MSTSKLQRYTGQELRRRFAKYGIVENTRPRWLVSSKGERLELDFYLERLGIAVEVQGKQHFEFTPVFHATKWDFQEQLRRDKEKLEICQRAGIDLLYVCKKSDLEIVLTACYDVLKSSGSESPEWTQRQPAWLSGRIKSAEIDREGKLNRGQGKASRKLILVWKKMISIETQKDSPRASTIEKFKLRIAKHKAILEELC